MIRLFGFCLLLALSVSAGTADAQQDAPLLEQRCDTVGIQPYFAGFEPSGLILASFDSADLWVFDIANNRRYPLPDTRPCGASCRLSPDGRWLSFFDPDSGGYMQMRLDGTQRSLIAENATDVFWWSADTLLVWTPGHELYLQPLTSDSAPEELPAQGVISVQPGGRWGIVLEPDGDENFQRVLVNLSTRGIFGVAEERHVLQTDRPYFNAYGWSPDGQWLAYVGAGSVDSNLNVSGGELYAIHPGDTSPQQWTNLTAIYGAVRIDGQATGQLSWSPDGRSIAFWVTEMLSSDPAGRTGNAVIHVLDITSGQISVFCGFSTTENTPDPPRLIWSPDSTHLAFGGNIPNDDKGYLLLALDVATGTLTELSNGLYPALGAPDPVAWGFAP